MLEGKTVNLRITEKEDLPLVAEWINNLDFWGKFNPFHQMSKTDIQKAYDMPSEERWFLIEKKDGSKVGNIGRARARKRHTQTENRTASKPLQRRNE